MKFNGIITSVTRSPFGNQGGLLQFLIDEVEDAEKLHEEIQARKVVIDVKSPSDVKKRSLSQNAYAWALINEIGNRLSKSKEEVYLMMLKHYGQSELISVKKGINIRGFVKYFEAIGEGTIDSTPFVHYRVYKGSSEFSVNEMKVFIDGVISEAQELGIQTLTPEEVAKWNLL